MINLGLLHVEVLAVVHNKGIVLAEAASVKQDINALAGSQFALEILC